MLAFVPALGGLFEDFVLTLLVFFNDAFEADVTPGFDPAMVAGEQKQQTRGAAIPVAERMDAQKVEDGERIFFLLKSTT